MFGRFAVALLLFLLVALPAQAASCFWVGGTGTWDQTNTGGGGTGGIKWASASGGSAACLAVSGPAAGVPGPSDTATFDASSGGGTVTVNFGGTVTIQSLTMGAFTGTFDNSVNSNNFTFSAGVSTPLNISGSGIRTINLGAATYTFQTSGSSTISATTVSNLTCVCSSSTLTWSGSIGARIFNSGAISWGVVTLSAFDTSPTKYTYTFSGSGYSFTNMNISAPNYVVFPSGSTITITNAFTWTGTASNPINISANTLAASAIISATSGGALNFVAMKDITGSAGTITANNCYNLGNNGGTVTCNAPSAGGGGIIGGWLLRRDFRHDNDNLPMFLRHTA